MDPVSAAAATSATAGTAATAGGLYAGTAGMTAASTLAATAPTAFTFGTTAAGTAGLFGGLTAMEGLQLGGTLLSGVQAAGAAQTSAELQAQGMQAQAFQEGLKAEEESIMRRERLLKALASQNVAAGASGAAGITTEALQLESLKEFQKEQRSADLMARTQQDIYRRKAAGTIRGGREAATGELLTTATRLADIG